MTDNRMNPLGQRLAWMPIPLLLGTIVALWVADSPNSLEAPYLAMTLNLVTRVMATLVIVYLIGRSFLVRGAPGLLLLGVGVAIWGAAGFVASAIRTSDANVSVAITNLGAWASALGHLAGVLLSLRSTRPMRAAGLWLSAGYTLALGMVGLGTVAALAGWLPVFFVPGQGGTLVRHLVLASAITMFALTAVLLWEGNRPSWSPFAYWYSLALWMIAVGLFGMMIESARYTPLDWACRATQYAGGIYMLIAAFASRRESGGREIALREITLTKARIEPRYRYGVAIAIVLAAAALRLVFLQTLGQRVAFLTFYPAVMLTALYGGLRAGLLATLLSAFVTDYFWIGPPGFANGDWGDWLAVAVFIVSCVMICGITEAMRRAQERALRAEAEAQVAVERQRAQETLERFELLARNTRDIILFVRRADGRLIDANEAAARAYGYSRNELLGLTVHALRGPAARSLTEAQMETADSVGILFETEHRRQDGTTFPVEVSSQGTSIKGDRILLSVIRDITERKRVEEHLKVSLREKEVMLKEIHHRVKNNLQVISSLVDLQAAALDNPALHGLFQNVRDRVRSMALVHEKLYQSESLARVEFGEYTRSLLNYLWRAHGCSEVTVRLKLELEAVLFSVETAVPCGLILNELVTNALKHAFSGRSEGEVAVALHIGPDERVQLRVRDNGIGLPAGLDWRQSRSLGMRLVQMLAKQLNGTVETFNGGGAEFLLTFDPREPEKSGKATHD